MTARALVIDDHAIARLGLVSILRRGLGIEEVDEACDSASALRVAGSNRPDLVLTDMRMNESSPPRELCRQLRAMLPAAPIVLVTAFDHTREIRKCLEAGATGCLLKDSSQDYLEEALGSIIGGESVVDPRVAQRLALDLGHSPSERGGGRLTGREEEVLTLLAAGRSNRAIAEQLALSEKTVKAYVSAVLRKLGVESRLAAVVQAMRQGLI